MREPRLIHLRPETVGNRRFSTSNPADQVRMLQTRDRTLQRKESQRRTDYQQNVLREEAIINDLNSRSAGTGATWERRGGAATYLTPPDDQGRRTVVSRADFGQLTPYQIKVKNKYQPLLDEIEKRRQDLRARWNAGEQIGYSSLEEANTALDSQAASLTSAMETPETIRQKKLTGTPMSGGTTKGGITSRLGFGGTQDASIGRGGTPTRTTPQARPQATPNAATGDPTDGPDLGALREEELAAIQPSIDSASKQKANVRKMGRAVGSLIDERGQQIDRYANRMGLLNEDLYNERKAVAQRNMDLELDLQSESLERQKLEEDLIQEKIERDYDRLEQKTIKDNLREEEQSRTALGARYGGFGSGAGMRVLNEQVEEHSRVLREIGEDRIGARKEYRKRLGDLEFAHRSTVRDIFVRHDNAISDALQKALDKAMATDEKVFDAEGGKLDAASGLIQDVFKQINDLEQATGLELAKANQRALDRRDQIRAEIREREQQDRTDAKGLFEFAFTQSSDPAIRSQAVKMMRKAGYDLPEDIDLSAMTPAAYLKTMDDLKKSDQASMYDIFKYEDIERQNLLSNAINAVSSLPVAIQGPQLDKITKLLDAGQTERARNEIRGIVAAKLSGQQKNDYDGRQAMVQAADELIVNLEAVSKQGYGRGIYTKKWNKLKKLARTSQDPEYLNITAALGNLSSEVIKDRYGANVTGPEWERANQYIPLAEDTVLDAITKLRQLKKYMTDRNDVALNTSQGIIETSFPAGEVNYDNGTMESWINGTEPPQGGGEGSVASMYLGMGSITQGYATPIKSRSQGGLYDESTVRLWNGQHKGLDIAMKQGTKLPAPVSGTVIEAGFQGGWGGTVVIRDEAGAEHRLSHLSGVLLRPGMKVNRGSIIAYSGGARGTKGAGNSTGAHLDYRVKVNGNYVDPATYYPARTIASTSNPRT